MALVTILDGAGWIGRQSDLRAIHLCSTYLLNINTIDQLDMFFNKRVMDEEFLKTKGIKFIDSQYGGLKRVDNKIASANTNLLLSTAIYS